MSDFIKSGFQVFWDFLPALIIHNDPFRDTTKRSYHCKFGDLIKLECEELGRTCHDPIDCPCLHGKIDITEGHENWFCTNRLNVLCYTPSGGSYFEPLGIFESSNGFFCPQEGLDTTI